MDYTTETIEARILISQVAGTSTRTSPQRLVRVAAGQRAKRDDDTLFPSHNVISPRALMYIAQSITVGGLRAKDALWGALRLALHPRGLRRR